MRRLIPYLCFPAILGGSVALTAALFARWGGAAGAVIVGQSAGVLAIASLERILPYRRTWLKSQGDMRTDTVHAVVNFTLTEGVTVGLTASLAGVAQALAERVGFDLWPADLPLAVDLALALVVAELGAYWVHRLLHEVSWLWPLHAPHHSPHRLYWLNAARFHPIDLVLGQLASLTPLVLLGAPPPTLAATVVFTAVHGMFQHGNIDVRLGPLNWVFSMAELHRWHHSTKLEEANTNYGANLILWDVVFGTRFLPAGRTPPTDIGIAGLPRFPRDYLGQLLSPWRYRRLEAEAAHD